jgi:hypothetical protein
MDDYYEFLNRLITEGKAAATADYSKPEDKHKLDGAIQGFDDCWGKTPNELAQIAYEARTRVAKAFTDDAKDYWYWNCRMGEIEWVCNVVSAATGLAIGGMGCTARGALKATELLNGKGCLIPIDEKLIFPDFCLSRAIQG